MNDIDKKILATSNKIELLRMDIETAQQELEKLNRERDEIPDRGTGWLRDEGLDTRVLNLLEYRCVNPRIDWYNTVEVLHGERVYTIKFDRWADPSIRFQTREGDQLWGWGLYISSLSEHYIYISRI